MRGLYGSFVAYMYTIYLYNMFQCNTFQRHINRDVYVSYKSTYIICLWNMSIYMRHINRVDLYETQKSPIYTQKSHTIPSFAMPQDTTRLFICINHVSETYNICRFNRDIQIAIYMSIYMRRINRTYRRVDWGSLDLSCLVA